MIDQMLHDLQPDMLSLAQVRQLAHDSIGEHRNLSLAFARYRDRYLEARFMHATPATQPFFWLARMEADVAAVQDAHIVGLATTPEKRNLLDFYLMHAVTGTDVPRTGWAQLDRAIVERVAHYLSLFRLHGVPSTDAEAGPFDRDYMDCSVDLGEPGHTLEDELRRELYRRDTQAYARYQLSGAPRFLHERLQAGPMSSLQYNVASFLSPRIRGSAPSGVLVQHTHPDTLPGFGVYPPAMAARELRVDVRTRAQRGP